MKQSAYRGIYAGTCYYNIHYQVYFCTSLTNVPLGQQREAPGSLAASERSETGGAHSGAPCWGRRGTAEPCRVQTLEEILTPPQQQQQQHDNTTKNTTTA